MTLKHAAYTTHTFTAAIFELKCMLNTWMFSDNLHMAQLHNLFGCVRERAMSAGLTANVGHTCSEHTCDIYWFASFPWTATATATAHGKINSMGHPHPLMIHTIDVDYFVSYHIYSQFTCT